MTSSFLIFGREQGQKQLLIAFSYSRFNCYLYSFQALIEISFKSSLQIA